jgi:RsiW-degrading membrane proteinase PrsW (M82 family)
VTGFSVVALAAGAGVSAVLLVGVLALLWFFDRYDSEPVQLAVGLALWGAIAVPILGSGFAIVYGGISGSRADVQSGLVGVLLVESLKAVGVLLVALLVRGFDSPADGFVYGSAVGLGCAAASGALIEGMSNGVVLDSWPATAAHVASTPALHALSGALFGGCVGLARLARHPAARALWVCGGMVAAVALHWCWRTVSVQMPSVDQSLRSWLPAILILYGGYFVLLLALLRSEHLVLKHRLEEEVELATVPPWVVDVIPYYRRRVRSDWWPDRRERTVLSRLLSKLAFRKHAIDHLSEQEAQLAGLELVQLRNRIRRVLGPPPAPRSP